MRCCKRVRSSCRLCGFRQRHNLLVGSNLLVYSVQKVVETVQYGTTLAAQQSNLFNDNAGAVFQAPPATKKNRFATVFLSLVVSASRPAVYRWQRLGIDQRCGPHNNLSHGRSRLEFGPARRCGLNQVHRQGCVVGNASAHLFGRLRTLATRRSGNE